ncbi:MAG: hypothetical protein GY861_23940, partial [bacterium]|nr:hypothetical protein [bacterium]
TMKNESLEEFLRRKDEISKSKKQETDWETKKSLWLHKVEDLYGEINDWLAPLSEIVAIKHKKITLTEQYVGSYPVDILELVAGEEHVLLKPMGILVVGSFGRVDMIGDNGMLMLLLVDEHAPAYDDDIREDDKHRVLLKWHFAVRTPERKVWPLTKESFTDALKQVMQQ